MYLNGLNALNAGIWDAIGIRTRAHRILRPGIGIQGGARVLFHCCGTFNPNKKSMSISQDGYMMLYGKKCESSRTVIAG